MNRDKLTDHITTILSVALVAAILTLLFYVAIRLNVEGMNR